MEKDQQIEKLLFILEKTKSLFRDLKSFYGINGN